MSFLKLIDQIDADKFEEEVRDDFLSRKNALGKMGNWSKKLALSAVPLGAFAAFAEPARAQSNRTPTDVLNYALTLELLEATYYTQAKESGVYVNPPADGNVARAHVGPTFDDIELNERQHVDLLQGALGDNANPLATNFQYNVAGLQPFENYDHFLLLAQAFEDTGVRAYKGQAGFLVGNPGLLTTALRIHSVEARHASAVRRIRGDRIGGDGSRAVQGWIPGTQEDFPDALQGVYLGNDLQEDNVVHAGVNMTQVSEVSRERITECFDEPLSADYVVNLVSPFIVS